MSLAYSWSGANGFPSEISTLFQSARDDLPQMRMLAGFPEHKVSMPAKGGDSQNDIFVIARTEKRHFVIAVEGKAEEPFDKLVSEWLDGSDNKQDRLNRLSDIIKIGKFDRTKIRYQLLHRLASVIMERERFGFDGGMMLIHSFSETNSWFYDYSEFLKCYGITDAKIGHIYNLNEGDRFGFDLYVGWAKGKHTGTSDLENVFRSSMQISGLTENEKIEEALSLFSEKPITVTHSEIESSEDLRELARASLHGSHDSGYVLEKSTTMFARRVGNYIYRVGERTFKNKFECEDRFKTYREDFVELWQNENGSWRMILRYDRPTKLREYKQS